MSKKAVTDTERIAELEKQADMLKGRCLQLERLTRAMAYTFSKQCMNESQLRSAAVRTNSFSNAFREVTENLRKHGNDFDRSPHIPDGTWS
jgi:hypothetical protein